MIRTIKPSSHSKDWEQMNRIYKESFEPRVRRNDLKEQAETDRCHIFITKILPFQDIEECHLKPAPKVISMASVRPIKTTIPKAALLEYIGVSNQDRHRGFGTTLVFSILESLKKNNFDLIIAEVPEPTDDISKQRIKFYKKLGAVKLAIPGTYAIPNLTSDFSLKKTKKEQLFLMSTSAYLPSFLSADLCRDLIKSIYLDTYGLNQEQSENLTELAVPENYKNNINLIKLN